MPQASDELRSLMEEMKFLEDAGYKLTRDWHWEPKPGVSDLKGMTRDEFECLLFLVHEWDFGGLKEN